MPKRKDDRDSVRTFRKIRFNKYEWNDLKTAAKEHHSIADMILVNQVKAEFADLILRYVIFNPSTYDSITE